MLLSAVSQRTAWEHQKSRREQRHCSNRCCHNKECLSPHSLCATWTAALPFCWESFLSRMLSLAAWSACTSWVCFTSLPLFNCAKSLCSEPERQSIYLKKPLELYNMALRLSFLYWRMLVETQHLVCICSQKRNQRAGPAGTWASWKLLTHASAESSPGLPVPTV